MTLPNRWRRWLRALFNKEALDREMDEEMRFHLEMEAEERMRAGMTPAQARRAALVAFGGVDRFREEGRDARGVRIVDDLLQDLRYGWRALVRSPAFTLVAAVTLALGVGANTAIFSVVNGVLLRPLPYPESDRLVSIWNGGHSRAEFTRVRDQNRTLTGAAAYTTGRGFSLSGVGEPERLVGSYVTAELFEVLRADPAMGRTFARGEDLPGNDRVVVLSHGLWRDRFGADSAIVGRAVDLDGIARVVTGVMPPGFAFPSAEIRLWVPLLLDESQMGTFWGAYGHRIVGRLLPGVTPAQARADVRGIARRLRAENPVWTPTEGYDADADAVPLRERLVGGSRRMLLVLLGAVGMILLIACANVANLLLARGTVREREIAIRSTLGAGRRRLVRQLVTESVLLAGLGGIAGLGLAVGGVELLRSVLPSEIPRLAEVGVDGPVLAFTAGLALLTGVLFGLAPALRLSSPSLQPALGEGGGRSGTGRAQRRLARVLVTSEIALAVVLVIGAGLFIRSFARLLEVDPGFRVDQVVTARVSPPERRYADPERRRQFYGQLLDRLGALPGFAEVGITSQLPFDQTSEIYAMWVDGYTTDPNVLEVFNIRRVTPGYFRVMGIPLVRGRLFTDRDRANGRPVAIVDETAVRRYWQGRDPLTGRIRYPWPGGEWLQVVGVVGSVKLNDLADDPRPAFYVPFAQNSYASMVLVARTRMSPGAAVAAIRSAVSELGPDVPVSDGHTMEELIGESVAGPRFASMLLLAFGILALLLGAVGTYGLMAYTAQRRTREIAVRMALGARARDVLGLVVRDGAVLAAVGVASGLAIALALTRVLGGLLFEVSPTDPVTFTAVPAVLAGVALLASYLPARRATRVDPMTAMRND